MSLYSLNQMVALTLRAQPDTRECDTLLIRELWAGWFPECFYIDADGDKAMKLDAIFTLPTMDDIKRERRVIQNTDGKYQASNPAVRKLRQQKEIRMRKKYAGRVF